MNFLASPMLVVAYALTGTMHTNLLKDSLGAGNDGTPVYLRDIWPTAHEIQEVIDRCLQADMFAKAYADVFAGDDNWRSLPVPEGDAFQWVADSTYVRQPPYFVMRAERIANPDRQPGSSECGMARFLIFLKPAQDGLNCSIGRRSDFAGRRWSSAMMDWRSR